MRRNRMPIILLLLLACIMSASFAKEEEVEETRNEEEGAHSLPPSLNDLQQQIVALRRDRDLDRIEIQTLRTYCETEKLSAMVERQKKDFRDLQWSRAHRRLKRSLMDPYLTLASKLEAVRSEVEAIRLLEDDQMPVLHSDLEKQQVQLSQLLNLTGQLAQELNKLKRQKHNREESTVVDYTPSELETIKNRLWHMEQRMTEYEDYMKWDELWSHRIQEQFSELIRNATQIHSDFEAKSSHSSSYTVDNELLFNDILNGGQSIEGSGSGDVREDFLPSDFDKESTLNHQWPYQLAAEISKLRLLHGENTARCDKLDSKVEQVVSMQKKLREKLDHLNDTKAEQTTVQNLTVAWRKTVEKLVQLENNLSATGQKVNFQNDATQNATDSMRLEIKVMKHQAQRAEKIAEVIKKVQNDHFNAIMNFSERVNIIDSDVTKYALKLTTLQADFLNATLFLYKESKNDYRQDSQIARLELRVEKNELRFPDVERKMKSLAVHLNDKIDYEKFKSLNDAIVESMDKLTMQSSALVHLEAIANATANSVEKLETQLTYDCSMDSVLVEATSYADGVYLIKPKNFETSIYAACEDQWTIIQRRERGLSFNRTFDEYAEGFGDVHTNDFWLGNNVIHLLTSRTPMALRIETWDMFDDYRMAIYDSFSIGNYSDFFRLQIGKYQSGNLTDSLNAHQGMEFSAYDQDRDTSSTHCARYYLSGWWLANCQKANLNGNFYFGLVWFDRVRGDWIQLKKTKMMIKPIARVKELF